MAKTASSSTPAASSASSQYLLFLLGGEPFGIDIAHVKEIIEYGQLTEIPMTPDFIRGVINLRGSVVPVIDLAARFGRPPAKIVRHTCIVIVEVSHGEGERQDIGVVVDSVSEVREITTDDIESAPTFGTRIRTDFIAGMARINQRFVILLNADRVLSTDEIAELAALSVKDEAN